APVSVIVFAVPDEASKAPSSRCRHLVKAPVVHWLSAVQRCAGGPSKVGENFCPQNPQNSKLAPASPLAAKEGLDCVPVERWSVIARPPTLAACGGGQSWLVGLAGGDSPGTTSLSGVQGWPAFEPAWHVNPGPGIVSQRGHGVRPVWGPVR